MRHLGLLRKREVCAVISVCSRTVDNYVKRYELRRKETGDFTLPSSPNNGLLAVGIGSTHRRFDQRDVQEYLDNSTLEALNLPLKNWRKKSAGKR